MISSAVCAHSPALSIALVPLSVLVALAVPLPEHCGVLRQVSLGNDVGTREQITRTVHATVILGKRVAPHLELQVCTYRQAG